jgi:hypothetical protein
MEVNINVFGVAMECGIFHEVDGTLVVTEKRSRYYKRKDRR